MRPLALTYLTNTLGGGRYLRSAQNERRSNKGALYHSFFFVDVDNELSWTRLTNQQSALFFFINDSTSFLLNSKSVNRRINQSVFSLIDGKTTFLSSVNEIIHQ